MELRKGSKERRECNKESGGARGYHESKAKLYLNLMHLSESLWCQCISGIFTVTIEKIDAQIPITPLI